MNFPYAAWVAGIERHHRLIVIASVVVCLVSAISLTRLRLDIDVLGMLPHGRAAFDDFKSFVTDFGELNELVVLIQGGPPDRLHAFADAFAGRLAGLDTVAAVHSRIDVQPLLQGILGRYVYNYLPEKDYAELQRRMTPAGIEEQVVADRAIVNAPFDLSAAQAVREDPLGVGRLAASALAESYAEMGSRISGGYITAADGGALLIMVRPKESAFDITFSERLMRQVREAETQTHREIGAARGETAVRSNDGVRVGYTGSYVYALEDAATLRWDIARYTILALAGVLAIFYLGYRNLRILPFVTYPLIVTTLLTFALSLLLFEQLNAVSISFAAILYGLAIDSAIYFYTRLLQERRGQDLRGAITATLAGLGRANLAASATTAAAFFVIGFSCLAAVSQLGVLTALGMLLTVVEFFTLYPALGFLLPPSFGGVSKPVPSPVEGGARWKKSALPDAASALETPRLGRWAEAAAGHARPVAIVAALLTVGLLFGARQLVLDVKLVHLRPQDSEAARVQDEIESRFGEQATGGAVLVHRPTLEAALADSEQVAPRLLGYQKEGLLRSVQGVQALLPSGQVQRARLALYNQLPRAAAVPSLQAALEHHGFVSARFAGFFADFQRDRDEIVHLDDPALAPLRFLIERYVRAGAGGYTVATYLTPAADVSLRTVDERLRRELGGLQFSVAARSLLEEELRVVLRRELAVFFILGLVGNFVLLLISFQRIGTAVAILAPVVMVVIILFACMHAAGIALDPVNLIVTPLLFGLGVDYGVYIVARAREQGAVPQAIRSAGRAVVVTALTTIAGFGFLGLSRFPALSTMGYLAGFGLFLCLALSIILLPALLSLLSREWTDRAPELLVAEGEGTRQV